MAAFGNIKDYLLRFDRNRMPHELPKAYDPAAIETRWAEYWVEEELFAVETPANGTTDRPVFTLLLPPPNVTGRLHMGHMLNQTEMDIIVRWHRMRGVQHAVAARHRSRRHRHPDDGGAPARQRRQERAATWAARSSSSASGSGSSSTAAPSSTR